MSGPLAVHCQPRASADEALGPCGPLAGASRPEGRAGLCPRSPAVSESPWTPLCPQTRGTMPPATSPNHSSPSPRKRMRECGLGHSGQSPPETGQEIGQPPPAWVRPAHLLCASCVDCLDVTRRVGTHRPIHRHGNRDPQRLRDHWQMAEPRAKPNCLGHQGKQKPSEVYANCHLYELIDLNEACSAEL